MKLWRKVNMTESLQDKLNTELVSRLRGFEEHLKGQKTKISACEAELAAVVVRLNVTEEQLDELRRQSSDRLTAAQRDTEDLQVRLRVSQKQLEDLKTENLVKLSWMESRLTEGLNNTEELVSRLRINEKQMEDLKAEDTEQTSELMKLWRKVNLTESLQDKLNTELVSRLRGFEEHLKGQKTKISACEAELAAVVVRLNVTEEQLDELRRQSSVRAAELLSVSDRLTAAQRDTEDLQVRLRVSEDAVKELQTENRGKLKVGFSAGLTDSGRVGPFNEETTLIFSKTITNVGHGYNHSAGVFTAPVRGLYFFSFTAADFLKGYMGLYLYRNSQPIVFSLDLNNHGGYATTSSTVTLQLEQGDQVSLRLPASYRLYDDSRNFSVFSGFLLFPL
ncbi:sodium channel and clathrin linker 1-like [Melanotaenia boesemani]|uniref:sodium channel and clathrin linker 1-like n=1 Tax=Melanotaenia boesemani TaxID=1250792 RepID=UPI001C040C99|nr:sodium channel and clathrin linker 1-like [Melanotaenia boesemani]